VYCLEYLKSFTWGQQVLSYLFWPFEVAADSISVVRALYFTKEVVVAQGFLSFSKKERFAVFRVVYGILVKGLFFLYSIWNPSPSCKKEKKVTTMPSV
jgi:hypothetical protein